MERNQGNLAVLGWNDSSGVIQSCVGTTPGGHSIPGQKDSSGVIMSWERTTQAELICPEIEVLQGSQSVPVLERLQGSYSVLRWNDSRGVILSWDGTTPEE